MANVILIDPKDNVGVVIEHIKEKDPLSFQNSQGESVQLTAQNDIRIYHKVAVKNIAKGEHVVKYAEHIGIASKPIFMGEHVHTHNVADSREDLSLVE